MRSRNIFALVAAMAAFGAWLVISHAAGDSTLPARFHRRPASSRLPPVRALPPSLADHFAVFASRRRLADDLPPTTRLRGAGVAFGLNAGLSRRLGAIGSEQLYLVPGKGWICLVDQYGAQACDRYKLAYDGKVATVIHCENGMSSSQLRILGLLPGRPKHVELRSRRGSIIAAVRNGAYFAFVEHVNEATIPRWALWREGARTARAPLPVGPHYRNPRCAVDAKRKRR